MCIGNRVSSDTAYTFAMKSTFLSKWAQLEQNRERVVVVGTTNNPSHIDPSFLRQLSTQLWVRGPEAPERFAMAKSLLSDVFHAVVLEPTPLASRGTTSLHDLLTSVRRYDSISMLTGADIAHAIQSATARARVGIFTTRVWIRVNHIPCIIHRATKSTSSGDNLIALPRRITPIHYPYVLPRRIASTHCLNVLPQCITPMHYPNTLPTDGGRSKLPIVLPLC